MLDNILDNMTIEILLRMTSIIRHFEYYHIWQKIGNTVYFDNIKYLLLSNFSGMLDNILDNMTIELFVLRMTSLIRHFEYYHIWQKIGNAVYFDNIKYLLLQIFRDVR